MDEIDSGLVDIFNDTRSHYEINGLGSLVCWRRELQAVGIHAGSRRVLAEREVQVRVDPSLRIRLGEDKGVVPDIFYGWKQYSYCEFRICTCAS